MKMSIFKRMVLLIIVPIMAGLLLVSYINYQHAGKMLEEAISSRLMLAVQNTRAEIMDEVRKAEDLLINISATPSVLGLLDADQNLPPDERRQKMRDTSLDILNFSSKFKLISSIGITDVNGDVVEHSSSELVGLNVLDEPYIRKALTGHPSAMTIPRTGHSEVSSALSVPVSSGGRVLGVVYCLLDMKRLEELTEETLHSLHKELAFIYAADGSLVLHLIDATRPDAGDGTAGALPEALRSPLAAAPTSAKARATGASTPAGALGSLMPDDQYPTVTRAFVAATTGGRHAYEWDGVRWLAFFEKIPLVDWTLVVRVKTTDIFQPVVAMTRQNLMLTAGLTLFILMVVGVTARRFSHLLTTMSRIARKVALGNPALSPDEKSYLEYYCGRFGEIGVFCQSVLNMMDDLNALMCANEEKACRAEDLARQAAKAAERAHAAGQSKRMDMLAAAQQLTSSMEIIATASNALAAKIGISERAAAAQAASAANTTVCMEQMHSTVHQVARSADLASEVSTSTRQKAEFGAELARKAARHMQKLQHESLELKEDMAALRRDADEIRRILKVVNDIADQTDVLALNASIEAARAGESGRSFSVVAGEVRKLTDKVMHSVERISEAVQSMENGAGHGMNQVDEAIRLIEEATHCASESGAVLEDIMTLADHSSNQIRAIAVASEQQAQASGEVSRAIRRVSAIAEATTLSMVEAAKAVGTLAGESGVLGSLASNMRQV